MDIRRCFVSRDSVVPRRAARFSPVVVVTCLLVAALTAASTASAEQTGDPQCPCSLWDPASTTPTIVDSDDPYPVEVGIRFRPDVSGYITAIRFYKSERNTGVHTANLWTEHGALAGTATFTDESASGWQEVKFPSAMPVAAGQAYVASYHTMTGHYSLDERYFATAGRDQGPLHAPVTGGNGVYRYGESGFPNLTWNGSNYWVDVVFETTSHDVTPPEVSSVTPEPGAIDVSPKPSIVVRFSEYVDLKTLNTQTIQLRTADNVLVDTTLIVNSGKQVTLTPLQLDFSSSYSVVVRGGVSDPRIKDLVGNALPVDYVSTFTTAAGAVCPCSIWNPEVDVPQIVDVPDANPIELGVKFRTDLYGYVTGIRFYKSAANTGTHIAHLWDRFGNLLATATFTDETATGWQEARFAAPVYINPLGSYVASYYTSTGHYSMSPGYFANEGVDAAPLHALSGDDGNGVYRYGASGFPHLSYESANYWVDAIFEPVETADTTPPTVTAVTPAAGATNVPTSAVVKATFSELIWNSAFNFELRTPANTSVSARFAFDSSTLTASLTPTAPLAPNTTYTARVRVGSGSTTLADSSGNALARDITWTFTTFAAPVCPCSLWDPATTTPTVVDSGDPYSVELGVKFRAATAGYITGLRFYKSAANTGTHTGTLWSAGGIRLATATFVNETPSGWQQVLFDFPVAVTAGQTYVVSYHTDAGHYSVDEHYFLNGVDVPPLSAPANVVMANGVYGYGASAYPEFSFNASNYWVDPIFTTFVGEEKPMPPVVTEVSPAAGSATNNTSTDVFVRFDKPMLESTLNTSTIELRDANGALVAGSVLYSSISRQVRFRPTAPLVVGRTYTIIVKGGTIDPRVKDLVGIPMASTFTSSFTISELNCPCNLWPATSVPEIVDNDDSSAVELGLQFASRVDGYITGVRFYKSAANTGIHTGSLWTTSGELLATGTFTNETASGWQEMRFASKVRISAQQSLIVSYHTEAGHYSSTPWYFWSGPQGFALEHGTPPLYVRWSGVYKYGSSGVPTMGYNQSNYWVDVIFEQ